jgi:hypothetical protein
VYIYIYNFAFLIIHVLGMQAKIGGRALTKEWIMP